MKGKGFFRLTKVDVEKREVHGRITEEVVDKSGEILDYEGSKPYFQKWSESISKATDGKSLGNVRLMHQPQAVGKLLEIAFDDVAKAIDCVAYISDDKVWKDICDGIYTGFSMGGKYIKRWADTAVKGATRFIADPSEVSVVDNPCVGTATYALVKADGIVEQIALKTVAPEAPAEPYVPTVEEVFKRASELAGEGNTLGDALMERARDELIAEHAQKAAGGEPDADADDAETEDEKAEAAAADAEQTEGNNPASEKAAPTEIDWEIDQVWQVRGDKSVHKNKADAKAHVAASKTILSGSTPLASALFDAIAKAKAPAPAPEPAIKFADPGLQEDGKKRLPLDTAVYIRAAWKYLCTPEHAEKYSAESLETVRKAVTEAWVGTINEDGPPPVELMQAFGEADGIAKLFGELNEATPELFVQKSLYTVSRVADVVSSFRYIVESVGWEEQYEKDTDSVLPSQGAAILQSLGTYLVEMAREEVAEMLSELKIRSTASPIMTIEAAAPVEMIKADEAYVEKVGARNSRSDLEKLQGIHDHSVVMGAKCAKEAAAEDDLQKAADAEALQKAVSENEELRKAIELTLPEIQNLGETVRKLSAELETTKADLQRIGSQPAPMPELPAGATVLEKGAPVGGGEKLDVKEALKVLMATMTPQQIQEAALESALNQPMNMSLRGA